MATPADERAGHFSGSRCRKVAVLPAGGIARREDERVLETVQRRLDAHPQAIRRCEPVGHRFGTLKARMGRGVFLMMTLSKVASEMALSVFDAMLHGRASQQCYPPVAHIAVN